MLFFQCKTNDFHSPRSRLARYGAVSEGLAGPYWPSQTTSQPPLDLQKIIANLIIFAHPAPSDPSCRSKGTQKCLDIRFQAKTQNFHPCHSKTRICGGQCTSLFPLFLHLRVPTCTNNCIRGLLVPSGGLPCRYKNHTKTSADRTLVAIGRSDA